MIKFVEKNKSNYVIYLDSKASKNDIFSARLFKKYIYLSTNVDLQIVNEKPNSNFIQFGNKHLDLNTGDIFVDIFKDSIFVYGEGEFGTSNATIELLNRIICFDVISHDNIIYSKKDTIYLNDGFSFRPSFAHRISTYGWVRTNEELRLLTRIESATDVFAFGNIYHNAFEILKYQNTVIKDEYLSLDKKQLCYSNIEMKKVFIHNLKEYINDKEKSNKNKKYFMLGMEDNLSWCKCNKCKEKLPSDLMVEFVNDVEREINKNRKEKIIFLLFAYYNTLKAGKVKCNDNVGVYFAPIKARFREHLDSFDNENYLVELEKWSKLTNHLFAWIYNFYTRRNLLMYDTFGAMKQNYNILSSFNVNCIYDQTESYSLNQTGFSSLKAYLQQKLQWNCNDDINELIKKYFENSYESFSTNMISIFNETRKMYDLLYKNEKINSYKDLDDGNEIKYSEIGQCIDKFNCLKNNKINQKFKKFLLETNKFFDEMLLKCENKTIKNRILVESITYKYLYLNLFDLNNKTGFNQLYENLKKVNITYVQEGKKIGKNIDDLRL